MPRPFKRKEEEKLLLKIWDLHFNADQARTPSLQQTQASMRLYYDQTLTDKEKQIVHERGQSDISVNFLRSLLRDLQAFMTSNQPQWTAFATGSEKYRKSKLSNALLSHNWRISDGYLWIVDIIKRGVVPGVGLFSNYIDYASDNGLGDVKFKSMQQEYFYGDWRSKHPLYKDMSFQQVAFTITMETALKLVDKDSQDDVKKLYTEPYNYDTLFRENTLTYGEYPDPQQLDRVRYLTHYQIEERDVWELTDLVKGEKFRFDENPDVPMPFAVDSKKITIPTLTKYDCLYGMGEDDGIIFDVTHFPFDDFLIVPFIDEWTGNPYGLGEAYFLEKLQKYADKMLRVGLQHEQWNSNPGVFIPEDSVQNKREFEKNVLVPGFVEEIDMENGVPIFKNTGGNSTGFFNIMEYVVGAMRSSMGNMFHPGLTKGNAKEDALLIQQGFEHGNMLFRNFQSSFQHSAKVALELSKYHYREPTLLKFIDERKRPSTLLVNKNFENEEGTTEAYFIEDVETDVALSIKSMTPTNNVDTVEKITAVLPFAPPQTLPLLFIELVKAMELDPDIVDEMEAQTQLLPQMMQQMEQLQQTAENLQADNKQLESQVFTADRKATRASYDAELQKQVDKFKTQMAALKEMFQQSLNMQKQLAAKTNSNTKK